MQARRVEFFWRIEFKAADCWFGAFPKRRPMVGRQGQPLRRTDLWICVIPMVPLHVWWYRTLEAA